MKAIKKKTVCTLAAGMLLSLSAALCATSLNVNAANPASFAMGESAVVRIGEDGKNGIRFEATMSADDYTTVTSGNTNVKFGMFIAPKVWADQVPLTAENLFGADAKYAWADANGNYDATANAGKAQISHMSATELAEKGDGTRYMRGSLVDIGDGNIAREFECVAYYTYDGLATPELTDAVENGRSMAYVAQLACADANVSQENKTLLTNNYINKVLTVATNYTVEYYQQNADLKGYTKVVADSVPVATTINASVTPEDKAYANFKLNTETSEQTGLALANDKSVLKMYYDRDTEFYRTFDVANMQNFAITTTGADSTLTVPEKSKLYSIKSFEKGSAFIAKMDYTYLGNVSDNGSGFLMEDSDGNQIRFMLVTWGESYGLCVRNQANKEALNLPVYGRAIPADGLKVQQTLTYANGVFTLWENDYVRNTFTLSDLTAKWNDGSDAKFSATEEFHVGYFTANGSNANGKFENMSVDFITDEATKGTFDDYYTYLTTQTTYTKAEGFGIMRQGTGDDYSLSNASALAYSAKGTGTHRMYATNSATAFEIEATLKAGANDHGTGFAVKDAEGNALTFMFVEWGGDGDLCANYSEGWKGAVGVGRYNVPKASGGTLTVPLAGTTVTIKMKYYNGTFMFYEKSGSTYKLRNYVTLEELDANMSAYDGVFTADEALTVGIYAWNGGSTDATLSNLSVNTAVSDAWKQEFNYFTQFNEASVQNFTVAHSATDTTMTRTTTTGANHWVYSRAKGNSVIASADVTYLPDLSAGTNVSDNGSGFYLRFANGSYIGTMNITWNAAKLALKVYDSVANKTYTIYPTLYNYTEPAVNLTVKQTLTYADGIFTLWENDVLRNQWTMDWVIAQSGNTTAFDASTEFYAGFWVFGGNANNMNGKFNNMSVEFITDTAKKTELTACYDELNNELSKPSGNFKVSHTADSYEPIYTIQNTSTNKPAGVVWSKASGTSFEMEATFTFNHDNDSALGFAVKDADDNALSMFLVGWGTGFSIQNGLTNSCRTNVTYTGTKALKNVTMTLKLVYSAGTFTLYEKSGDAYGAATATFALTTLSSNANATQVANMTADEAFFVGIYGASETNTSGTIKNVSVTFGA